MIKVIVYGNNGFTRFCINYVRKKKMYRSCLAADGRRYVYILYICVYVFIEQLCGVNYVKTKSEKC